MTPRAADGVGMGVYSDDEGEQVRLANDQFICAARSGTCICSIHVCVLLFVLFQELKSLSSSSRMPGYFQVMVVATTTCKAMGARA